jgi:hypothetical protein
MLRFFKIEIQALIKKIYLKKTNIDHKVGYRPKNIL